MNWGQKLVLAMILFMTFIVSLGVMMFMNEGNDELIEKNYYEKGLNYNSEYKAQQNVLIDSVSPLLEITQKGLSIAFKQPAHYQLNCKKLSDANQDKIFKGETGDSKIIFIEADELGSGLWFLELHFQINGKSYLLNREIRLL